MKSETLNEIVSFFRSPPYRARIPIQSRSSMLWARASSPSTGTRPSFTNTSFLPWFWHDYIKPANSSNLWTVTKHAVYIDSIKAKFVIIGDPWVRAWSGTAEKLPNDTTLVTYFVDSCIRVISRKNRRYYYGTNAHCRHFGLCGRWARYFWTPLSNLWNWNMLRNLIKRIKTRGKGISSLKYLVGSKYPGSCRLQ